MCDSQNRPIIGATLSDPQLSNFPDGVREKAEKDIEGIEAIVNEALEESGFWIEIDDPAWMPGQTEHDQRYHCDVNIYPTRRPIVATI